MLHACAQVLALQALQPLLLVCGRAAGEHMCVLVRLLAGPGTPPALQLQVVTTAGALISARPVQSRPLVKQLQQLLLRRCSPGTAAICSQQEQHQQQHATAPAVAAAAAGVYCQLLLQQKLLLAADSWAVVAAGLLARDGLEARLL